MLYLQAYTFPGRHAWQQRGCEQDDDLRVRFVLFWKDAALHCQVASKRAMGWTDCSLFCSTIILALGGSRGAVLWFDRLRDVDHGRVVWIHEGAVLTLHKTHIDGLYSASTIG